MSKKEFSGRDFFIRHTVENDQPHNNTKTDHFNATESIMILIKGKGVYCLEGNRYPLSDGDVVVMGMDTVHSFRFEETGFHERLSIYFSSSILSPFWEHELPVMEMFRVQASGHCSCYSPGEYHPKELDTVVSELCRLTDLQYDTHTAMDEARIHMLILRLLFLLYDCYEKQKFSGTVHANPNTDVMVICRYIKEHFTEDLSYSTIQNKFFVSRYFLSVVFRQNTGLTLTEYILHTRLLKVNALVQQGYGLVNAASMAGFKNYSNFYKEFKKHRNISPKEYYR